MELFDLIPQFNIEDAEPMIIDDSSIIVDFPVEVDGRNKPMITDYSSIIHRFSRKIIDDQRLKRMIINDNRWSSMIKGSIFGKHRL